MTERLRILMIAACPFPWPRGTPIRIHRMAEALVQVGHEVHVATYHLGERSDDQSGIVVHRISDRHRQRHTDPGPTAGKLIRLDPALRRLTHRLHSQISFDIVHAHHYEGLLVADRARADVPVVYDAHTTLAGELPYYRLGPPKWLLRRVGSWLDRRVPRRADYVVSVSESIRQRLVGLGAVQHDRIAVIPNGVDWRLFDIAGARPPAGERLIFTGNLSAYQRIDLLLQAFAHLLERRPRARLSIVTNSPFTPFEEEARRRGILDSIDVVAAPFHEQPMLLRHADVAVNPRVECDGIPQKLLNYMASGTPVVTFDGSAAHVVHQETGLRVPDGDTQAMARALERLLANPELAERIGAAAQEQIRREFSWSSVADQVTEVYRKVLGPSRRSRAFGDVTPAL